MFALLRKIALSEPIDDLHVREEPYAPIRFLNHWDNLDGTIERGYAGKSIFWENGHVVRDLSRVRDYARLMASVGINGCSINNVNADVRVITPEYLPEVARIAAEFRKWGVRMLISLNFASPRKIGGIETFDPLDPQAVAFWKQKVDEVYRAIPDLAGFVLKADSEGRLGPSEYGRTPADAANAIARALKPHGGVLFYRGFVYDHLMDWRDLKNDRATAAYNNFHKLDGLFEDNVIIQIKHGPIDFQVREPPSPLFGGLEKTNQAIELQITQEYLGQQRHLCYIVPMWKEVLDFDMHATRCRHAGEAACQRAKRSSGRTAGSSACRTSAATRTGSGITWRWRTSTASAGWRGIRTCRARQIADEWTRQTFGHDSDGRRHDRRHAAALVADLRELHGPARHRHAHRHHSHSFRPGAGVVGIQRLGAMASGERDRRGHGPHRRHRHRLHRPVSSARCRAVRIAGNVPRRLAAVHAPCAVHASAAQRQNGDSTFLRHALSRGGGRRAAGRRSGRRCKGRIDEQRYRRSA